MWVVCGEIKVFTQVAKLFSEFAIENSHKTDILNPKNKKKKKRLTLKVPIENLTAADFRDNPIHRICHRKMISYNSVK